MAKRVISLRDQAWATGKVLSEAVMPDLIRTLLSHPHRTWRESQAGLLARAVETPFWHRETKEIYKEIATIIGNTTRAEWGDEHPDQIQPRDQNNVIRIMCIQTGTYQDVEKFRLPCTGGELSVLDEPTLWDENLKLMLFCLDVRAGLNVLPLSALKP